MSLSSSGSQLVISLACKDIKIEAMILKPLTGQSCQAVVLQEHAFLWHCMLYGCYKIQCIIEHSLAAPAKFFFFLQMKQQGNSVSNISPGASNLA